LKSLSFHRRNEQSAVSRISKLSAAKSSIVASFSIACAFTGEMSSQQFLEFPNYLPPKAALSQAFQ